MISEVESMLFSLQRFGVQCPCQVSQLYLFEGPLDFELLLHELQLGNIPEELLLQPTVL